MINFSRWLGPLCLLVFLLPNVQAAGKIEAVKGKKYELTKQHGPWMIMVASLSDAPPEYRVDGPSPVEAANDLVYELRKKGIPAYFFEQKEEVEALGTIDRDGKKLRREVKTKDNRICVVAGNYSSSEESVAQKTLTYIKNFKPESFGEHAVFRATPGRPNPLSGAFLTINPLLSPEDIAQRKTDPLLLKINSDRKYSLLTNHGQHTLVVASFFGRTRLANDPKARKDDDDDFGKALDEAGRNAEVLCQALRGLGLPKDEKGNVVTKYLHHQKTFDAFVWHERDRSLVCVGEFSSQQDPMIARTYQFFAERKQEHPVTKVSVMTPQSLMVPELDKKNWKFPTITTISAGNKPIDPLPKYSFAFDPKPKLIAVPLSGKRSGKSE